MTIRALHSIRTTSLLLLSAWFFVASVASAQTVTPTPGGGAIITPGGGSPTILLPQNPVDGSRGPTNPFPVGDTLEEGEAAEAGLGGSTVDNPGNNPGTPGSQNNPGTGAATNRSTETAQAEAPGPVELQRGFAASMYSVMITIGGAVTWVGGNMLDYSVEILVVKMGRLLTENIGVAVDTLWVVVRDIFNIIFIFALIWIGLSTIVKADESIAKRALPGIIIAALFINFSLFITKAIVDFSNVAATQIYSAFSVPENASIIGIPYVVVDGDQSPAFESSDARRDISVAFVQSMRLQTFASDLLPNSDTETSWWRIIGFGFLMMIVLIIAGFVFLAGAIMLIVRFVTLVILMIFSPFMFLGLIDPRLAQYGKSWWNKFLSSAFVAPAYLFMLYLCLTVFTGLTAVGTFSAAYSSGGSQSPVVSVFDGGFAIFLYFAVMVAFLLASVKVASSMSAAGGGAITAVGNYGANTMRGWAKGAGRGVGGYGKRFGQNAGATMYRKMPLFGGKASEDAGKRLEEARAKKAAGMTLSASESKALRRARFTGAGSLDAAAQTYKKRAEYSAFGGTSATQVKATNKKLASDGARKKAVADLIKSIESGTPAKIEQAFSDMTNPQLLEIAKTDEGFALIEKNARYLSANQLKAIADSDDINDEKTGKIAGARKRGIQSKFANPADLKSAGKDELTALGYDFLKEPKNAVRLKEDQIKNLDLIDTYKEDIRTARKDGLVNIVTAGTPIGGLSAADLAKLKPSDVASLPDGVFGLAGPPNPNIQNFVDDLPFTALSEISKQKNRDTQQIILPYLEAIRTGGGPRAAEMNDWRTHDPIGKRFGQ